MSRHQINRGVTLIDGISALGSALGYVVKQEHPVEKQRKNSSAVDVAWFREAWQDFPLMIFEVESKVTNSAANNAVKVFGQPNERFEKPLFFFHVFVTGGHDTSRVDALRSTYGSHNYRAYCFEKDDETRFVKDILSQHRRLARDLDLLKVAPVLEDCSWKGLDIDAIMLHVEDQKFNINFLSRYAVLGIQNDRYRSHYIRYLTALYEGPPSKQSVGNYESYIGYNWAEPIHLGLLSIYSSQPGSYLDRFRQWQDYSTYLTMIGPHFGLSRDYDEFVIGMAPSYLGFITALMHKVNGASIYIANLYRTILDAIQAAAPAVSFFPAIWLLHVSTAARDDTSFDYARSFINNRGGINTELLYQPPTIVSIVDEDEQWHAAIQKNAKLVPEFNAFQHELLQLSDPAVDIDKELVTLALDILINNDAFYDGSRKITSLLHASLQAHPFIGL